MVYHFHQTLCFHMNIFVPIIDASGADAQVVHAVISVSKSGQTDFDFSTQVRICFRDLKSTLRFDCVYYSWNMVHPCGKVQTIVARSFRLGLRNPTEVTFGHFAAIICLASAPPGTPVMSVDKRHGMLLLKELKDAWGWLFVIHGN